MACVSNERIKEAREQLDKIRADKELMERIRLEEAYETDRITSLANAREEGEVKAKRETAKNMLELGAEVEFISKATGLSVEEIEKLKEEK